MEITQKINKACADSAQDALRAELEKHLLKLVDFMPTSYIKRIKEKIGKDKETGKDKFSNTYISQFFRSKHAITPQNSCILDAALELVNEEDAKIKSNLNRVKAILK